MVLEMFPDRSAVEEALLRFAGLPHAASRALEALLARSEQKAADDDDLDYDCADWETWEDDCACGRRAEGYADDDAVFYCLDCWEDWDAEDGFWEDEDEADEAVVPIEPVKNRWSRAGRPAAALGPPDSQAASPEPSAARAPSPVAAPIDLAPIDLAPGPAPGPAPKPGFAPGPDPRFDPVPKRGMFMDSLARRAMWSEAPRRPEEGKLVTLKPKSERGADEAGMKKKAAVEVSVPRAAFWVSPAPTLSRTEVCKQLLEAAQLELEAEMVDYVASLVEEDLNEDTRAAVLEILDGNGVPAEAAECLWQGLLSHQP